MLALSSAALLLATLVASAPSARFQIPRHTVYNVSAELRNIFQPFHHSRPSGIAKRWCRDYNTAAQNTAFTLQSNYYGGQGSYIGGRMWTDMVSLLLLSHWVVSV